MGNRLKNPPLAGRQVSWWQRNVKGPFLTKHQRIGSCARVRLARLAWRARTLLHAPRHVARRHDPGRVRPCSPVAWSWDERLGREYPAHTHRVPGPAPLIQRPEQRQDRCRPGPQYARHAPPRHGKFVYGGVRRPLAQRFGWITRAARRSSKNSRNMSSVSMQSWKPARRALIVLLMLSKPELKMKSPNFQLTTFS